MFKTPHQPNKIMRYNMGMRVLEPLHQVTFVGFKPE